jgi:hypothetical protein
VMLLSLRRGRLPVFLRGFSGNVFIASLESHVQNVRLRPYFCADDRHDALEGHFTPWIMETFPMKIYYKYTPVSRPFFL